MVSAVISRPYRFALLMGFVAVLAACDQFIKVVLGSSLPLGSRVEVTEWLNVVHALNPGAAFSVLANAGGWQRYALTLIGLVVSGLLLFSLWRGTPNRFETIAFVFVIGGAMGNVSDRIRIGAVVDYIDLHWGGWHWPAFNLADVFVVGGMTLLLLSSLLRPVGSVFGNGKRVH